METYIIKYKTSVGTNVKIENFNIVCHIKNILDLIQQGVVDFNVEIKEEKKI